MEININKDSPLSYLIYLLETGKIRSRTKEYKKLEKIVKERFPRGGTLKQILKSLKIEEYTTTLEEFEQSLPLSAFDKKRYAHPNQYIIEVWDSFVSGDSYRPVVGVPDDVKDVVSLLRKNKKLRSSNPQLYTRIRTWVERNLHLTLKDFVSYFGRRGGIFDHREQATGTTVSDTGE